MQGADEPNGLAPNRRVCNVNVSCPSDGIQVRPQESSRRRRRRIRSCRAPRPVGVAVERHGAADTSAGEAAIDGIEGDHGGVEMHAPARSLATSAGVNTARASLNVTPPFMAVNAPAPILSTRYRRAAVYIAGRAQATSPAHSAPSISSASTLPSMLIGLLSSHSNGPTYHALADGRRDISEGEIGPVDRQQWRPP